MASPIIFSQNTGKINDYSCINIFNSKIYFGLLNTNQPNNPNVLSEHSDYVLVRKRAFSCNFRDKTTILCADEDNDPDFAYFGSDFVGEVVDKGINVTKLKIGDKVIPNGCYPSLTNYQGLPTNEASSEYEYFPQDKLVCIDRDFPDEIAAAFTIGAQTAYGIVEKLEISMKKKLKVLLWSPNSNTSIFILNTLKKYSNIEIYGLSSSLFFKDALLKMGMSDVILYDSFNEKEQFSTIIGMVGKFDIIIDPFADLHFVASLDLLCIGGRYITCGIFHQFDIQTAKNIFDENEMSLIFPKIIRGNFKIIGNCLGTKENLLSAIRDFESGQMNVIIDSIFTSTSLAGFLYKTYESKQRFGKVVYKF